MATDFRDGKTFPRRGREPLGEALWLARLFDKARAAAGGTLFDYIYPCPMDKGVMALGNNSGRVRRGDRDASG